MIESAARSGKATGGQRCDALLSGWSGLAFVL